MKMKRAVDVIVSGIAILILLPLMALIALLVRRKLGSPALFRQVRSGQKGHPFTLLKFRTMSIMNDNDGASLPDHMRLTSFGRRLRATSLDEIPQLLNVFRGDMSLVGPRPLLMEYLPYYKPEQARRHEMRPGITGWAQINGRNAISWEEKFRLDVWYVDNYSLILDVRILALTVLKIFRSTDVNASAEISMPRFDHQMQERGNRVVES